MSLDPAFALANHVEWSESCATSFGSAPASTERNRKLEVTVLHLRAERARRRDWPAPTLPRLPGAFSGAWSSIHIDARREKRATTSSGHRHGKGRKE